MTEPTNKDVELAAQLEAILGGVAEANDPFTADPFMTAHLLAVLIKQAGGKFVFTQATLDQVDGCAMSVDFNVTDDTLTVTVEPKKVA
jgi:hypothetical protein